MKDINDLSSRAQNILHTWISRMEGIPPCDVEITPLLIGKAITLEFITKQKTPGLGKKTWVEIVACSIPYTPVPGDMRWDQWGIERKLIPVPTPECDTRQVVRMPVLTSFVSDQIGKIR